MQYTPKREKKEDSGASFILYDTQCPVLFNFQLIVYFSLLKHNVCVRQVGHTNQLTRTAFPPSDNKC